MTQRISIINGRIIDGTGRDPIPNGGIVIENGQIVAVDAMDTLDNWRDGAVIDVGGNTITPGFIDCHVHFVLEDFNLMTWMAQPFSLRFYAALDRMRRTLDAGVTSVRDAGGADLGMKQAVERGMVIGPRMQISISILTITGGHADYWMPSGAEPEFFIQYPGFPDGICDGVDDVRRKAREVLRAGADIVKICSTGGVMSPTDHPDFTQFTPDEIAAVVQEAAYRGGRKVMAHAQGTEGIKNAIRAGVHSIEHGIFLDDEAIDLMLEHGTYLVPTLLAPVSVLEMPDVPSYALNKAQDAAEAHATSIAKAVERGVKIAMGTDAGVMRHGTNLRELGLMVTCGMTPMQAIEASTRVAAECLGWGDMVGTLEVGKRGDVVVVDGNPLADINILADTDNIVTVLKDGQLVKQL